MVQVRHATISDLPALSPLTEAFARERAQAVGVQQLRDDCSDLLGEMLGGAIQHPASFVVVAEADGQPVGYASCSIQEPPPIFNDQPYLFLSDLYVVPERRGQGIGSRLIQAVRGFGLVRGILRVSLVAPVGDAAVQQLLQKLEFKAMEQLYFWQG